MEWFGKEGVEQKESILDQALPMLETLIRRDRNHPCVILWSMCNESKTDTEVGIKVMRRLIQRTKELDRTRLVTFVTAPGAVVKHRAYEEADLVATNMYPGSLAAPLADHVSQLDERARKPAEEYLRTQLAAFPDKPMLITEFGAMGFHGVHGDAASTEDFQAAYIARVWEAISGNPDVAGGVLWSWADYHHRRNFLNLGAFGPFGVVTIDRQPKQALKALSAGLRRIEASVILTRKGASNGRNQAKLLRHLAESWTAWVAENARYPSCDRLRSIPFDP